VESSVQERDRPDGAHPERTTKMIQRMKHLSYKDRLRELRLEKRRLQGDLRVAFQCLKGSYRKENYRLFSRICCDRARGSGFKQSRLRLDIRKKSFAVGVMKHWISLPRVVVDAPFLETFKTRLDQALVT